MDNLITVGIAKGIKSPIVSEASSHLTVGTIHVDQLIRMVGTITKGPDGSQIQHMAVPQWNLIAELANCVNDATLNLAVKRAIDPDNTTGKDMKKRVDAKIIEIKGEFEKPTSGKVTTSLTFTEV
jgi:hypothetical protein